LLPLLLLAAACTVYLTFSTRMNLSNWKHTASTASYTGDLVGFISTIFSKSNRCQLSGRGFKCKKGTIDLDPFER
jgi:hypothetical protein